MKATINGLRFDTENAIKIGDGESDTPYRNDFSFWSASLYHTPQAKRYFLAGSGGPMTIFCRSNRQGDEIGFGAKIIPMEPDEALKWAERYLTMDEVEKAFGDSVQDA